LCVSSFAVSQGAIDTVVDASGFEVGLQLGVDRLRMVLVKPLAQFFELLGRERVYRAFNFL